MQFHYFLLVAVLLFVPGAASAFERDVHFGLTKWLALQAGFTLQQSNALATGNQRVDAGLMQFIELLPLYACLNKDEGSAVEVGRHHYPTAMPAPAPPEQRTVIAGSDQARQAAIAAVDVSANQAGIMLYKFGEALHTLQDSWSHQGIPDSPRTIGGLVACDAGLAWAHPSKRGGSSSHKADLTHAWPADVVAMAQATYDLMLRYPLISEAKRDSKPWPAVLPSLTGFVRASTKAQKRHWFAAQGIADVSFLEGITLQDGGEAFTQRWDGHKLPKLSTLQSTQPQVDPELLDFFSRFIAQWVSSDDFDALASDFAAEPKRPSDNTPGASKAMGRTELVARLTAWRVRDHGLVAGIAHSPQGLSSQQRNTILSLSKGRDGLARYDAPGDALFPLMVKTRDPAPLLGFLVNRFTPLADGHERATATLKFRHTPYDTVQVFAQRLNGRWHIVSLAAVVDH